MTLPFFTLCTYYEDPSVEDCLSTYVVEVEEGYANDIYCLVV